jgi:NitT/TauT family transport system substrate-binding protein
MRKKIGLGKIILGTGFLLGLLLYPATKPASAETIRIGIGTQDATINTVTAGGVVREYKLLEKYLPHDGKYKDVQYDIVWHDFTSGAPINGELLANKLDIGIMADFPSIVGAAAFLKADTGVRTYYIASTSGGIHGAGNAIVVPIDSPVQSFSELKGKTISVPFASTAHAALLRAIEDQGWDPEKDVTIVTQAPEVAGSALKSGQIDAHADFVPYGELFPFRGIARKIYDGSETGVTTTHGIQVRSDFAEKYPELLVAYLKATLEADKLFREDPVKLSEEVEKWTGVNAEVVYAFHGPHGIQTRDYSLKPEFVNAIRRAEETLHKLKKTELRVDIGKFVNDKFIRQAATEFGLDYDKQLKDYSPVPFEGNAEDTQAPVTDAKRAGQVWVKGEERVRLYSTAEAALRAADKLQKEGNGVRVIYVHDRASGNKLFADKAWYVNQGGKLSAFLLKGSAQKWAAKQGGNLQSFEEARQAVTAALPKKGSPEEVASNPASGPGRLKE